MTSRTFTFVFGACLSLAGAAAAAPTPGVQVTGQISIWGGASIDAPMGDAVVATNSTKNMTVQMAGQAVVKGDVYVGPGADPANAVATWGSSEITGATAALDDPMEFPDVTTPDGAPANEGAFQLVSNQTETITTDRRFSNLRLYGSSTLTIDGDVTLFIDNSIDMSGDASVVLEDGSTLAIYVGGNIGIHQTASINAAGGDAADCRIFLTQKNRSMELTTDSRVHASVQSESARLRIWNTAEFTGTFVGQSLEMGDGAKLHIAGAAGGSGGESLLAHFTFDESFGKTARDKVGGATAALKHMSGNEWTDGKIDGALAFDGSKDYAIDHDAASYLEGHEELTVSVWVKADSIGHDRGVLTTRKPNGHDYVLSLRYDKSGWSGGGYHVIKGAIKTDKGYLQIETQSNVQTTDWQHLAMVWRSGEKLRLFIGGKEAAITGQHPHNGVLGGVTAGVDSLIIGNGVKNRRWRGLIDDLRFYNAALDPEQIAELAGDEPGKIRLFKWAEVSPGE